MFLTAVRFFAFFVMLFLAVSAWPYVPDDLDFISPEEPAKEEVKKIPVPQPPSEAKGVVIPLYVPDSRK